MNIEEIEKFRHHITFNGVPADAYLIQQTWNLLRCVEEQKKVLEFYADQGNYGHEDGKCSPICTDGGKKAREALK